jgi:hypothetical protein
MTDEVLSHIARRNPPWRVAGPSTQCGRASNDVASVIPFEEAQARAKKLGQQRFAMTHCMTCVSRVQFGRGTSWEANPLGFLIREVANVDTDRTNRELHALAALAANHPEEFATLLAAGNDLADRRAQKGQRR